MTTKRYVLLFTTVLVLLASSCGTQAEQAAPSLTAVLVTATSPPTLTSVPSETPLPPPPQPTIAPVEGTSSTQINVRSEPSTSGNVLGIIGPNTKVQIVGKDPTGNWWQIQYEQGPEGKGWVTAQYVTIPSGAEVPIVGSNTLDPNNGNVAIVQQQINIRSGPGTDFNSLGTLNPQDVVSLTGKDANGAWLQIAFSAGPDGKGWVNAAFVQARGVENLPIVTGAGQIVGTGTPTDIPFTPTPTIIPAWADNDSQNNPVVNVVFEPNGTHTLIYNGDISSPNGDPQDWVNFEPYGDKVFASLTCTSGTALQTAILENGVPTSLRIACGGEIEQLSLKPGAHYSIQLYLAESTGPLQYSSYMIKIYTSP